MKSSILLLPLLLSAVSANWIRHVSEDFPADMVDVGTFTLSRGPETHIDTANSLYNSGLALKRINGDGDVVGEASYNSPRTPFLSLSYSSALNGLTNFLSGNLVPVDTNAQMEFGTASVTDGILFDASAVHVHTPETVLPIASADTPRGLLFLFYDLDAPMGSSSRLRLIDPMTKAIIWERNTANWATDEFAQPISALDLDEAKENFFVYTLNANGVLAMCKFSVETGDLVWSQPTEPLLPTGTSGLNVAGASIASNGEEYYLLGSSFSGKSAKAVRHTKVQTIKSHRDVTKPKSHQKQSTERIFIAKFTQNGIAWSTEIEADIAMTVKVLSDDRFVFAIVHHFSTASHIHRFDAMTGELLGTFEWASANDSGFMYFTHAECAHGAIVFSGMAFSGIQISSSLPILGSPTVSSVRSPFILAKINKDLIPGGQGPGPNACEDRDEAIGCGVMAAKPDLCSTPYNGMLLREMCPNACGCCSVNGMCVCDQNEIVESNLGQWGYNTCMDMLNWPGVECNNGFAAALMQQYCPCTCSR